MTGVCLLSNLRRRRHMQQRIATNTEEGLQRSHAKPYPLLPVACLLAVARRGQVWPQRRCGLACRPRMLGLQNQALSLHGRSHSQCSMWCYPHETNHLMLLKLLTTMTTMTSIPMLDLNLIPASRPVHSSNANDETISSSPMQRSFLHLMRIVRPLLLFLGISAAFACILSFLEGANELRSLEIAAADWDRHQTQLSTSSATIRASLHGSADGLASLEVLLDRLNQLEGSRPVVKNKNWTFIGSLYFVFTVSTTIGYGTFAPVTTLGRAFTVIACFVGIGSFIRILAQICPVYSHYFRKCSNLLLDYLIEHPQEGDWLARLDENDRGVVRALTTFVVNLTMGLALVLGFGALFEFLAAVEGDTWGFWECVYFAVVTLTTVGLGDHSLRWYGPTAIFEISMFVLFTTLGLLSCRS